MLAYNVIQWGLHYCYYFHVTFVLLLLESNKGVTSPCYVLVTFIVTRMLHWQCYNQRSYSIVAKNVTIAIVTTNVAIQE